MLELPAELGRTADLVYTGKGALLRRVPQTFSLLMQAEAGAAG